uniref:Putative CCT motif family protein isoform 2 n=1 Tax=Davidia involucrata TaxID=16924 RepID=A0A5B7AME9_DAVIN
MLEDMSHPPEQLSIEEISSPLSAQILEFCNTELFQETLQNSEVASSSNCCYEENSSYTPNLSFVPDINKFTNTIENNGLSTSTTTPNTTTDTINNNSNLSMIFDSTEEIENDISASIDFSPSPPFSVPQFIDPQQQEQFDLSSLQSQVPVTDVVINGLSQYTHELPLVGPPLSAVYEEEVLSSMPSYMGLNPSSPSCSFLDHTAGPYLPGNLNAALSAENSGIFTGSLLVGMELNHQELEYEGDNGGIFCPESLPRIFNSSELQAPSNEGQHLVSGGGSSTPLASEISSLEDSTFKVGKLSVEQRKEKIHRYMKKRNERNFSKKIKYACRKTLADSRPRVRGRFAKNDEFGETTRTTCSNHEEDTDEDVVVKEEDDISSDIFAHISGVNSFKCNYPIQSWI